MPISNPCSWFVTGSKTEEYEYEGGNTLYHFSGVDSGIDNYHALNLLLLANNEAHAKQILIDLFNHRIACAEKYLGYTGEHGIERAKYFLSRKDEWKITLAPTNQVYKVGWASNDTIL